MEQQTDDFADDEVIETLAEAAEYAGVDEATIEQWEEDEMRITEDGYYVKSELDLYKSTGGKPTIEDRSRHAQTLAKAKKERARSQSDKGQEEGQVQPDLDQSEDGKSSEDESGQDKTSQSESDQEQPSQSESDQPDSDGEKTISGRTIDEWVADGFPRPLLEMLFERY